MAKKAVKKAAKVCDEKTQYTCMMQYRREYGKVEHWHAIDINELAKASHNPPDFTYPFDRTYEDWPKECECPKGCKRMVRDSNTKDFHGLRVAWRRTGAGGTILEVGRKTIETYKVEVTFVCAKVEKEESVSMEFDERQQDSSEFPAFATSNDAFIESSKRGA